MAIERFKASSVRCAKCGSGEIEVRIGFDRTYCVLGCEGCGSSVRARPNAAPMPDAEPEYLPVDSVYMDADMCAFVVKQGERVVKVAGGSLPLGKREVADVTGTAATIEAKETLE